MGQKKLSTEAKIENLAKIVESGDKEQSQLALSKALKEKSNFLVAKAAQWCGEHLNYELIPDLVNAYDRFLQKPFESDKTCAAKRAIARALYELDYDNVEFYKAGIKYIQLEPVWGGHVDTAVELRCTSALGLGSSDDPRAMLNIIELVHDEEPQARICALKALELMQSHQAEVVLRYKILQGDAETEVINQCFSSLMKLAPEESLDFVANFLEENHEINKEGAALALGESRLDEALTLLIEISDQTPPFDPFQLLIFQAIALQRNDKAFEYLLNTIKIDEDRSAGNAITALSVYNYNSELKTKIETMLAKNNSSQLNKIFKEKW